MKQDDRDRGIRALEALRAVSAEYGLSGKLKKPCVAALLDGSADGERHNQAFVLALELRAMGLTANDAQEVGFRWATKLGILHKAVRSAVRSAFLKNANGTYRYFAPGLKKKPNTRAHEVLGLICEAVGCPTGCPAYQHLRRARGTEGFGHFERLGWPEHLRRCRKAAAVDWYRALCRLEQQRSMAAGTLLYTSSKQLAPLAGRDRRWAMDALAELHRRNLLSTFIPGTGSGPAARDRSATVVARAIPIPRPPL